MCLVKAHDRVGFLDVAVECVVHRLDVFMSNFIEMGAEIVHRVDQVALETVERLEADYHAPFSRRGRQ